MYYNFNEMIFELTFNTNINFFCTEVLFIQNKRMCYCCQNLYATQKLHSWKKEIFNDKVFIVKIIDIFQKIFC